MHIVKFNTVFGLVFMFKGKNICLDRELNLGFNFSVLASYLLDYAVYYKIQVTTSVVLL